MKKNSMNPRMPGVKAAQEIINSIPVGDVIKTSEIAKLICSSLPDLDYKKLKKDISSYLYNRRRVLKDVVPAEKGSVGYIKKDPEKAFVIKAEKKIKKIAKPSKPAVYIVWRGESVKESAFLKISGIKKSKLDNAVEHCKYQGKMIFKASGIDEVNYYLSNMKVEK